MANQVRPAASPKTSLPPADAVSAVAGAHPQHVLIDELMQREIYIYVDKGENQFGRPFAALVLVGPGTEGHVRIGGKDLTIEEGRAELARIQELLARELDLSTFAMVMDTRDKANMNRPEWSDLSKLAWDSKFVFTPCGVENFPPIPMAAEPAQELP